MAFNLVGLHIGVTVVRTATIMKVLPVLGFLWIVLEFLTIEIRNIITFFVKIRDAIFLAQSNDSLSSIP